MKLKRTVNKVVSVAALVSLIGCASIVSKSNWPVTIQSNPSGAQCLVAKEDGNAVHAGETPMTITLQSGGGFFQRAKYTVTCDKPGYEQATANADAYLNGWYFGNAVFGGLIGLPAVDPATGAMYRTDETQVVDLVPAATDRLGRSPRSLFRLNGSGVTAGLA